MVCGALTEAKLPSRKCRSYEDLKAASMQYIDQSNPDDESKQPPRKLTRRISSVEDMSSLHTVKSGGDQELGRLVADLNASADRLVLGADGATSSGVARTTSALQSLLEEPENAIDPELVAAAIAPPPEELAQSSAFFAASEPLLGTSNSPPPVGTVNSGSGNIKMAQHPSVIYPPLNSSPTASGGSSPVMSRSSTQSSLDGTQRRSSYELPRSSFDGRRSSLDNQAAEELFYRLNHARQTVDFVKRQASNFAPLNRATMTIWEALDLLNTLREYENALMGDDTCDPDMPLIEHAMQTAEACRLAFPDKEWMPIVGLIHGLGKILAHTKFGSEPQWAVCGESFPVGCRHSTSVVHAQYFSANPDRRRKGYATPTGMYQAGCGLSSVCMSWSGAEYLYMVLAMNKTLLPPEALFVLRHQKFAAVLRAGQPYNELLSDFDRNMLPVLKRFRELSKYKRVEIPGRLEGDEFHQFYSDLLAKYIPQKTLRW